MDETADAESVVGWITTRVFGRKEYVLVEGRGRPALVVNREPLLADAATASGRGAVQSPHW
jgi:hypothetical protein